jgi:trehalose 6-phosphate phosphatase
MAPDSAPAPDTATAIRLARAAVAAEPAGLLSDIDGTLAPIVRDPDAVRLADGAADALAALAERLAIVAFVTGRAAADARRISGLASIGVAGNHGTEWLPPGAERPEPDPRADEVAGRLQEVLAALPALAGVEHEHKGLSATVHYRKAPDPGRVRDQLLAELDRWLPPDITLRHGRMSLELRPAGLGDKGSATRDLVDRYGLRGAIVLGDDLTDLDMFRAAAELRADGRLSQAAIIAVGSDGEVPPEVHAAADAVVDGQEQVVALLTEVARR